MVWGMSLPSSFGDFWPEGRFESDPQQPLSPGWRDRLIEHFLSQTAEVQKELFDYRGNDGLAAHRYPSFVSSKFITEQGVSINADKPPITAIKAHEPPRFYQTRKNHSNLASLVELCDRIIAVDEGLKSIIEKLEPGVHQFFPIEIRMRRDKIYPASYYILVIRQYLDSFLPDESREGSYRPDGPIFYFHEETKEAMQGLTFRKAAFGDAELWRERRLSREWLTCFSDELVARIAEAGLRIPKHYKMMEV